MAELCRPGGAFGQFEYPTPPFHLLEGDKRAAAESMTKVLFGG